MNIPSTPGVDFSFEFDAPQFYDFGAASPNQLHQPNPSRTIIEETEAEDLHIHDATFSINVAQTPAVSRTHILDPDILGDEDLTFAGFDQIPAAQPPRQPEPDALGDILEAALPLESVRPVQASARRATNVARPALTVPRSPKFNTARRAAPAPAPVAPRSPAPRPVKRAPPKSEPRLTRPRTPNFATSRRPQNRNPAVPLPTNDRSPFQDSLVNQINKSMKATPDRFKRQPTQPKPFKSQLTRPVSPKFHSSERRVPAGPRTPGPKQVEPVPFKHHSPNRKIFSPSYAGERGIRVVRKKVVTQAATPPFAKANEATLRREVAQSHAPEPVPQRAPVRRDYQMKPLTKPRSPKFATTARASNRSTAPTTTYSTGTRSAPASVVPNRVPAHSVRHEAPPAGPRGLTRPVGFRFRTDDRQRPAPAPVQQVEAPPAPFRARPMLVVEDPFKPELSSRPLTEPETPAFLRRTASRVRPAKPETQARAPLTIRSENVERTVAPGKVGPAKAFRAHAIPASTYRAPMAPARSTKPLTLPYSPEFRVNLRN